MDCSTPGLPVHHQLPEFTHILMSIELVMPSNHLILWLQSFPASGSIPMSQYFTSGGQSTGVSASASDLPMNIQDWFPLGWTGWISLQSKGLSRVFSNTTVQKHQFSMLSFLYSPTITPIPMGKTIALTRWTFVGKVKSLFFKLLIIPFHCSKILDGAPLPKG